MGKKLENLTLLKGTLYVPWRELGLVLLAPRQLPGEIKISPPSPRGEALRSGLASGARFPWRNVCPGWEAIPLLQWVEKLGNYLYTGVVLLFFSL
jgi:hypothetical protein